jgi:hypothetical protein
MIALSLSIYFTVTELVFLNSTSMFLSSVISPDFSAFITIFPLSVKLFLKLYSFELTLIFTISYPSFGIIFIVLLAL